MARKPRVHLPGGYYHVMMRGNLGSKLFFSDADRTRFLFLIQQGLERYGHRVHAFCLMDNHVHLLIQVGEVPLSRIIQNICFRYTRYINHQKKSIGHLFQGRFKAILIDADSYLLELVRYIHLNPVRAGLCKSADEFSWTSYHAYTGKVEISWLYHQEVLSHFSNELSRAQTLFSNFVIEGMGETTKMEFHQGSHFGSVLGDDAFAERVLKASHVAIHYPLQLVDVLHAVADEYDIDPTCLYEQGKGRIYAEARSMAALLVQGIEEISLTTLATELGRDLSAVSQAGGRLRKKLSKHKILHDRFRKLEMHIKTLKSQA